jgi:hypothetical protein
MHATDRDHVAQPSVAKYEHNDAPMLVKGLEWHFFDFFRNWGEIEFR